MRPDFIGLSIVLCFIDSFFTTYSQMALFGDVYIAPQNELHIGSGKLYFEYRKIITDRWSLSGTLSFAHNSSWEKADHNTHVDGFICFYHANKFTFPVGHDNVLEPSFGYAYEFPTIRLLSKLHYGNHELIFRIKFNNKKNNAGKSISPQRDDDLALN